VPWAVTLAIFAFLFSRIPLGRVVDTLAPGGGDHTCC